MSKELQVSVVLRDNVPGLPAAFPLPVVTERLPDVAAFLAEQALNAVGHEFTATVDIKLAVVDPTAPVSA